MKCIPVPTTNNGRIIAFDVTLIDAYYDIHHDMHPSYGGGTCFQGKVIGKAVVVLGSGTLKARDNLKVLFLSGYRNDGKVFNKETEDIVVEECKTVAKVFWG